MEIPKDIESLILDYWWSHHMFKIKQRIHRDIRHLWMLREIHVYYDIFYSPFNPNQDAYHPIL